MTGAKLSGQSLAILEAASPSAIQQAAQPLKQAIESGDWITARNLYWPKPESRFDSASGRVWRHQLAGYMAAAVPEHCVDGWSYLGRALQSHMRGDMDSARHLSYYAELRAVIALLMSQGIGVFNRHNIAIDAAGQVTPLPKNEARGTHRAAWLLLEAWGNIHSKTLEKVIAPQGFPLEEWLSEANLSPTWSTVGPHLLGGWGLDLKRLSADRESRNSASYLPTRVKRQPQLGPAEIGEFVAALWSALCPDVHSPFDTVDRDILRETLRLAVRSSTPPARREHVLLRIAETAVRGVVPGTGLSLSSDPRDELIAFLTASDAQRPPSEIVRRASETVDDSVPTHHLSVMGRAVLLLRVATGAARHMLFTAGVTAKDLEPWMIQLGTDRGLWGTTTGESNIVDKWQDIEDAIDYLAEESRGGANSVFDMLEAVPKPLSLLAGCELIPISSLAA